ncbi:MAG: hypothetical protein ACYTG6_03965 [Planctomycetota bacterium]
MRIKVSQGLLVVVLAIGLTASLPSEAGSGVDARPLSDFLDGQGSVEPGIFFPPVADYVGWVGSDFETFALVDYAGLANAYVESEGGSLHTNLGGIVKEYALDDGSAEVRVRLRTGRALAFAQSVEDLIASGFDFLNTPTIFGAKAQDVVAGTATPALGWVHMDTTFTIGAPGDPLPDFMDVLFTVDYAPATLDIESETIGERADGTRARLRVHQVASTVLNSDGEWEWVFTTETVEVVGLGD